MPSVDDIAALSPTAAKMPRLSDHATEYQVDADAALRAVHVEPSGDVMTRFVPSDEIATNRFSDGE